MAVIRSVAPAILCIFTTVASGQQPSSEASLLAPVQESAAQDKLSAMSLTDLQRLAQAGNGKAANELAVRYRFGSGGLEKDPSKAAEWLHRAAAAGVPIAYFNLGVAYYNGDGVAVSEEQSCKWFVLAKDAGVEQAAQAVERATSASSPGAFRNCEWFVASAYAEGKEVSRNYARALNLYKKMAEEGDGRASERIAVMYDHGWGVPSDAHESLLWLQRASQQKNPLAMYELGKLYEEGKNLPQDYGRAVDLYKASSSALFSPALVALSKMYLEGRGLKANPQTAYMWALLAETVGNSDGKKLADSIQPQLSRKEVDSAKKEARAHVSGKMRLNVKP